MFNYRFGVILPHKKFTWSDFGRVPGYIYPIPPVSRRYALERLGLHGLWEENVITFGLVEVREKRIGN